MTSFSFFKEITTIVSGRYFLRCLKCEHTGNGFHLVICQTHVGLHDCEELKMEEKS